MFSPRRASVFALLAWLMPLCGCQREVGSVSLSPSPAPLLRQAGETFRLEPTVTLRSGEQANIPVRWLSSEPEVASVAEGVVTAHRSGKTVVTAEVGGVRAWLTVRVAIASSLQLRTSELELFGPGHASKLSGVVRDEDERRILGASLECRSLDEKVVHAEGARVVAKAAGSADVVCSVNGASSSVAVRVFRASLSGMSVTPNRHTFVARGQTLRPSVTVYDKFGTLYPRPRLSFSTSNSRVVTVSNDGELKAGAPGHTLVTVTAGNQRASVEVFVEYASPSSHARGRRDE